MAWENAINNYAIGNIFNGESSGLNNPSDFNRTSAPSSYTVIKGVKLDVSGITGEVRIPLDYGGMFLYKVSNSVSVGFYFDTNYSYGVVVYPTILNDGGLYLLMGVDETNQEGQIIVYAEYNGMDNLFSYVNKDRASEDTGGSGTNRQRMYNWIKNNVDSYNWSSVTSISGKGNTYNLTEILNINDGNAVNNVQASENVDFTSASKVNNLIDAVMDIDPTKVKVTYSIPEGDYQYIKLVYKRDLIPTDYTDGTAIDITQASTEQVISGINDGNTYYFVIFTDKSVSEPKDFSFAPNPDEIVLYDNGTVNTTYFDTDATVTGHTQAEPLSYNYEAKSDHLLLEYNNMRDTIYWRGLSVAFDKKTFPSGYTKIKLDIELSVTYYSEWVQIYATVNEATEILKNFNEGENVIYETWTESGVTYSRYVIGDGRGSYDASDRWVTQVCDLGNNDNYLTIELNGVNQWHEASMKIYKITLIRES